MAWDPRIDVEALTAIDVHVHVHASSWRETAQGKSLQAMAEYFGTDDVLQTAEEIADHYRSRKMAAIIFGVDDITSTENDLQPSNDEIAETAAAHSDVLIPFASIDPRRGRAGAEEAERLIEEHNVQGFKFHPSIQAFRPNDGTAYPLFEVIEKHERVALFHTGQTGMGSGAPGGGGIRLKYSNPMYIDDVAVDFPRMPIIMAHPSVPWQDEALAVAVHKPSVYIDLSGWSPKYFPEKLVQYSNTLLKEKVMFGSDFPVLTPERWMRDLDQIEIRESVLEGLMKGNAARLLGLK